jgi:hypothetical protein
VNWIVQLADIFGIRQTPWIIRVYIVLLLICVGLIVGASTDLPAKEKLFDFGMDSFKLVLGAVIGSLSMAAQTKWGGTDSSAAGESPAGK